MKDKGLKILLFGEFSGLHYNLKKALIQKGHSVTLASNGDGYKQFPSDIFINNSHNGLFTYSKNILDPFINIDLFSGYDVVQIINPFFPNMRLFPRRKFFNKIIARNKKVFLLAAGSDAQYWQVARKRLRYGPFDDTLKYDYRRKTYYMQNTKSLTYNNWLGNSVHGIIPVMYDYQVGYEKFPNLTKIIPIPIDLQHTMYAPNKLNGKIQVLHGLTRYGFKGTKHIEKAFTILESKYPNEFAFKILGNTNIDNYLKILTQCNVLVDQTSSYSLGVNALMAMAKGKIVLGGAEPESLDHLPNNTNPAINITPDHNSIVEGLEKVLKRKNDFIRWGLASRNFVENWHCSKIIAKRFLNTWEM